MHCRSVVRVEVWPRRPRAGQPGVSAVSKCAVAAASWAASGGAATPSTTDFPRIAARLSRAKRSHQSAGLPLLRRRCKWTASRSALPWRPRTGGESKAELATEGRRPAGRHVRLRSAVSAGGSRSHAEENPLIRLKPAPRRPALARSRTFGLYADAPCVAPGSTPSPSSPSLPSCSRSAARPSTARSARARRGST